MRKRTRNWVWPILALSLGFPVAALPVAALGEDGPQGSPQYESHVAPILQKHCVRCHNERAMKAELNLASPQGMFRGGESGLVVAPRKLEESLLYDYVAEGYMPPEGEGRLSADEVDALRQWIEAGTPFESLDPSDLVAAAEVNNHDIEPLMRLRCTVCHGLRTQEAGLDLRTKASMLAGGKSGPAIVLGKPEESLVLKRIHAGEMPPNERLIRAGVRPMSAGEIEKLARWIELGAPEVEIAPDVATTEPDPLVTDADRGFWSFQPPKRPAVPQVQRQDRVRNAIDAFLLRKLEAAGLEFSPEADKLTLLRRASFELTGLPPTPEEIERFLSDEDDQAYERMIDRLLASPRYGEKWGRMWLDLAGYADSEGKRSADPIRPSAWRYRDYVIRSLNDDKPYDRFLLEQIAGDELADYSDPEKLSPQVIDNLVATGFLRMAPDGTGSDVVNRVPERMEVISDELDIFGSTVLGLSIKCARCHSHKYDPIPQRDYYRLVDIFKGAFDEHDWLKPAFVPGQTKDTKPGRVLSLALPEELEEAQRHNRRIEKQIAELDEKLAADTEALGEKLDLEGDKLKRHAEYKALEREHRLKTRALEGQKQSEPQIRALWDRGQPSPTYIYRRGDHLQPSRLVGPGVPSVLTDGKTPFVVEPPWPGAESTGRRLALARWLTKGDHPLTARVMVNRIWKGHFGQGIVKSLGNFGKLGTPPTHPELLDWLATEFVQRGWSVKDMHRLMMASSAWRQVSTVNDDLLPADPDNSLVSRMPMRRMDAEEVRDSLLYVAGKLDERRFGRPDDVTVRGDGLVTSKEGPGGWRRSVYIRQRRKEVLTVLETFDLPQMNPACQERTQSNVAQQALYLLNNAMAHKLAGHFAERVAEHTASPAEQIEWAYLVTLNRPPSDEELVLGRESLEALQTEWSERLAEDADPQEASRQALHSYCHTILNSAGFVYID